MDEQMQCKAEIAAGFAFLSPLHKAQVAVGRYLPPGVPRGVLRIPCSRPVPLDRANCQNFPKSLIEDARPLWGVNQRSVGLCTCSSREVLSLGSSVLAVGWEGSGGIASSPPEPVVSLPEGSEQGPGHAEHSDKHPLPPDFSVQHVKIPTPVLLFRDFI